MPVYIEALTYVNEVSRPVKIQAQTFVVVPFHMATHSGNLKFEV